MSRKKELSETSIILEKIIESMQDKKARHIISMDMGKINTSVTDYFVICHAPSKTQVDAIYKNVIDMVQKDCGEKPFNREGYENSEWILIDYFDVVVHVFQEDVRKFYKLEDLWADAEIHYLKDLD